MKKSVFSYVLFLFVIVFMLEGCGNTEVAKEEGMISETASVAEESTASEEISVESTEEVSEEISEEVAAVDYSADTVIALCDELAQKIHL